MSHAPFSPSSLPRVMRCPGSFLLTADLPDSTSEFAERGTKLHAVAECILRNTQHESIDSSELETLRVYTDYVKSLGGAQFYEVKLHHNELLFGTADCVAVCGSTLNVIDLKCGQGVRVLAEENEQLMAYALMAYDLYFDLFDIDTITVHIVQPWLDHVDAWTLPYSIEEYRARLMSTIELAQTTGAPLVPGEKQCKFCKAKATCPARADEAMSLAKLDFAAPQLLGMDQIAEILPRLEAMTKWAKDVQEYALSQALGGARVKGHKLVAGRSIRKYGDEQAVSYALTRQGLNESEFYKRTLIGITDMEKLLGKKEFEQILGAWIVKSTPAPTLVPEADKRQAITTAQTDFQTTEG